MTQIRFKGQADRSFGVGSLSRHRASSALRSSAVPYFSSAAVQMRPVFSRIRTKADFLSRRISSANRTGRVLVRRDVSLGPQGPVSAEDLWVPMAGAHRRQRRPHKRQRHRRPNLRRLPMPTAKSVRSPGTLPVHRRRRVLRLLQIQALRSLSRRCLRLQAVSPSA